MCMFLEHALVRVATLFMLSVICDLNDPHKQDFLRGHDDNISVLTLSKSVCWQCLCNQQGKLIASGQIGENADVCVWDFASRKLIYRLNEHDSGVSSVSFTDDDV